MAVAQEWLARINRDAKDSNNAKGPYGCTIYRLLNNLNMAGLCHSMFPW